MHRNITVVLLIVAIGVAVSAPLAAQKVVANSAPSSTPNITVVPPSSSSTVNSYDVSARNIVRLADGCPTNAGSSCSVQLSSENAYPYTVPTGKRLVIRGISAGVVVPPGNYRFIDLRYGTFGYIVPELHLVFTSVFGDVLVANSTATDFYVDQGGTLTFDAYTGTAFTNCYIYAWGYLVDCGKSGCTAG